MMEIENESLQRLIEKAIELAERTGEFAIEQAPELLQEFYAWHTATSGIGLSLGVIGVVACLFWARYIRNIWGNTDEREVYHLIMCGGLSAFSLTAICINAYNLIKITIAPKLYLIEHFLIQNQ
jgi:hypothetical protein